MQKSLMLSTQQERLLTMPLTYRLSMKTVPTRLWLKLRKN